MGVLLSKRGLEYSELSRFQVQEAFRHAYDAIEEEQQKLRHLNPMNPLLSLVTLRPRVNGFADGMDFADSFRSRVLEHTGIDLQDPQIRQLSFYYLLGAYVDLLCEEQIRPKFLLR